MRKSLATFGLSVALLTMPVQVMAQSAEKCLSPVEAEALMVTFLPDVVESLSAVCKTSLPESARLADVTDVVANVYRPASEAAAEQGGVAFARLMGDKSASVNPALLKALAPMMVTGAIGSEVKASDCADIESIYSALEPLPPQNMGRLLVALVKLGSKNDKKGKANDFLCPAAQ